MLRTALLAALIAGFASGAMAIEGPKYDRKIEAAVKKIVAKRVGGIRGAFDAEARLVVAGETEAIDVPAEQPLVEVALLDVAAQPVFQPSKTYHSGRPEPLPKVRRVTSFQYF